MCVWSNSFRCISLIIYTSMQLNLPDEEAQLCMNAPNTAFNHQVSKVLFTQIYKGPGITQIILYLARIECSCPRSHFRALYIYGWFELPWTLGLLLFILLNLSFERLALIRGKSPVYYVHFIYKVLMCLPDSGCESHIWRWVSAHQTES